MKIFSLITCLLLLLTASAIAQKSNLEKAAADITAEGKMLYQSEMASWYGTDIFLEKYKHLQSLAGGYLSYDTGKGMNNIFFGKGNDPQVLITISFDYSPNPQNYTADTTRRPFNTTEQELYAIRRAAVNCIQTDTLFKHYNNTGTNVIPVNYRNSKKVYIITSPEQNGLVIMGNDYVIDFDKHNQITDKKKIHQSIIVAQTGGKDIQVSAMHNHLPITGDYMTPTDVCTLMLYGKHTSWENYMVISQNYVSLWDVKKQSLVILTVDAWKKITADVAKRNLTEGSSQ
jgi:hypothetical protein